MVFQESIKKDGSTRTGRCAHFYACICSFVNQDNLRQEFASYIQLEVSLGASFIEGNNLLFAINVGNRYMPNLSIISDRFEKLF